MKKPNYKWRGRVEAIFGSVELYNEDTWKVVFVPRSTVTLSDLQRLSDAMGTEAIDIEPGYGQHYDSGCFDRPTKITVYL